MIVVSMTTIPSRIEALKNNLITAITQTLEYDKLLLNIDDDTTEEFINEYNKLKKLDPRIEINLCDKKWRSCNKLLPAIKKYPEADIITIDDDVRYNSSWFEALYTEHKKYPKCIISFESRKVELIDNGVKYTKFLSLNMDDLETPNIYMSKLAYFPTHTFDNTDLFNYEKMIETTDGNHDELWFWINSTLNGVKNICRGMTFDSNVVPKVDNEIYGFIHNKDDEMLCNINEKEGMHEYYTDKINKYYGPILKDIIQKTTYNLYINDKNIEYISYAYSLICYSNIAGGVKTINHARKSLFNYYSGYIEIAVENLKKELKILENQEEENGIKSEFNTGTN